MMTGKIISHCKILEKLGAGGMGLVYNAHVVNVPYSIVDPPFVNLRSELFLKDLLMRLNLLKYKTKKNHTTK